MEVLAMLQVLGRHRRWLAVGVAVALLAAISTQYRVSVSGLAGTGTRSGSATARMLLLTGPHDDFDLASKITVSLPERAALVADLATTDAQRTVVARAAGVDPAQLNLFGPAAAQPNVPVPIAVEAEGAAQSAPAAAIVRLDVNQTLPIITIHAVAPTPQTAARLATAASRRLEAVVAEQAGPKPLVAIAPLGSVTSRALVDHPGKAGALIAFVMTLLLWACGIVLVAGLRGERATPPGGGPAPRRLTAA